MSASPESKLPDEPVADNRAGGRASEQLLRAILDHSRDINLAIDRDGSILYQSPHAARVIELASPGPGQPRLQDCMHPEDRARWLEELAAYVRESEPAKELRCEFRLRHRSGEWRWFEVVAANLLHDPAVAAILLDARDVTQRRENTETLLAESVRRLEKAESALRLREWRYRTVAEVTPGFVQEFTVAPDGEVQLVWASEGFEHIIGMPVEDVVRRGNWLSFLRPDEISGARERLERMRRGESTAAEVCMVDVRGNVRWLHSVTRPVGTNAEGVTTVLGVAYEITDRKIAERRLAESEAQFRLALENAPIGIALALPDGRSAQVNRRLCELLGYEAAQFAELGGLVAVTHPADVDADRALQQELRAGARNAYDTEKRLIRKDGSEILTATRVAAIRGADGQLLYILSEIEDVTAQRATEAALRTSEALLRAVTENVPDLLLLLDLDLCIRFANRSVLGTPPAQLVGRSVLDFVPLVEQDHVSAVYQRAIMTRQPQVYEVRTHVGGEPRWFENRVGPVIQDDCIVSITVASSEITARRRGEEALRTQGRILDTMREGVIVMDATSTIRLVNPAMARLTGYEPRDLLGRSGHVITRRTRHDYLQLLADLDRRLASDQFVDLELECVRRDGTSFTASCVMTPIEIGGERHRLGVLEDITQRRELEHEIIEIANREQRRIGSDLHDGLGQELTGVALMLRGLAGRLRKEGAAATADADEIVALVNGAIDSARSLARGLSPVSIERGGLPFAIRALCTRASDMYGVQVRFRSKVWPQLTLDTAPSNHLYRVAQEAVTNAVKHGRATEVVVDLVVTGEHVQLMITDNGAGLPPAMDLAQGMGLKIMRYRANMVSGNVQIGPAPGGVGTRVTMACIQPAFSQPMPAREAEDEEAPQ
jgi:PAS domain S-box-containing protein